MAVPAEYAAFLREQLARLAPAVTTRPMFGGLTFYSAGKAFALTDGEGLYLKGTPRTRPEFEGAGLTAFAPSGDPADGTMNYFRVPDEWLDDAELLAPWVAKALAAAAQGRPKKKGT